jgi:hypothetical protein
VWYEDGENNWVQRTVESVSFTTGKKAANGCMISAGRPLDVPAPKPQVTCPCHPLPVHPQDCIPIPLTCAGHAKLGFQEDWATSMAAPTWCMPASPGGNSTLGCPPYGVSPLVTCAPLAGQVLVLVLVLILVLVVV